MAPRANWKGFLRLSLVSCPIALYPASSESGKVRLHMLNKETGNRLKRQMIDAETGDVVDPDSIIRGYEVAKNEYIEVTDEELAAVQVDSTRTIDIDSFVPRDQVDDLYINNPYYIVPDGEVGKQAYAVIRAAIAKTKMLALGRVVLSTREHVLAIEPRGKGLFAVTLRYPYEVRDDKDYFDNLGNEDIPTDMLDLAVHIVKSKTAKFDPSKFKDRYEQAMVDLIRKKQKGERIVAAPAPAKSNVINLMDALRQSVEGQGKQGGKPGGKPEKKPSPSPGSRRGAAAAPKRPRAKRPTRKAG